jgi:hypothetical protein
MSGMHYTNLAGAIVVGAVAILLIAAFVWYLRRERL